MMGGIGNSAQQRTATTSRSSTSRNTCTAASLSSDNTGHAAMTKKENDEDIKAEQKNQNSIPDSIAIIPSNTTDNFIDWRQNMNSSNSFITILTNVLINGGRKLGQKWNLQTSINFNNQSKYQEYRMQFILKYNEAVESKEVFCRAIYYSNNNISQQLALPSSKSFGSIESRMSIEVNPTYSLQPAYGGGVALAPIIHSGTNARTKPLSFQNTAFSLDELSRIIVTDVDSDGNCLPRALGVAMGGTESSYQKVNMIYCSRGTHREPCTLP